jgi:hypothetical protein
MELYFDLIPIDLRKEVLKSVPRIYLVNTTPDMSLFQFKSFIPCNSESFWKDLHVIDISLAGIPTTVINRDEYSKTIINVSTLLKSSLLNLFNSGVTQLIILMLKNDWRGILDWHKDSFFCESCHMCNFYMYNYIIKRYNIHSDIMLDGLKHCIKTLFQHPNFFFNHNGRELLKSLVENVKKHNPIPQVVFDDKGKPMLYGVDLTHILIKDEFQEIAKLLIAYEILSKSFIYFLIVYIIDNLPHFSSTAVQTSNILYLISVLPEDERLNDRKKTILGQAFSRKNAYLIQQLITLKCSKIEEQHLYLAANISRELFDFVFSAYTTQNKELQNQTLN